ncbi:hypothetical protein D9M72_426750 [compost metagenome]
MTTSSSRSGSPFTVTVVSRPMVSSTIRDSSRSPTSARLVAKLSLISARACVLCSSCVASCRPEFAPLCAPCRLGEMPLTRWIPARESCSIWYCCWFS